MAINKILVVDDAQTDRANLQSILHDAGYHVSTATSGREALDKAQSEKKPFYINVWPDDVHSPFWPPVEKWGDGSKRTLYLSVLEEMDRQLGRLAALVSNAGILDTQTTIENVTADRVQRMLATNVIGSFVCCLMYTCDAAD